MTFSTSSLDSSINGYTALERSSKVTYLFHTKKTNLEILGRPNFVSVGELSFRRKLITKQSRYMNGFIKFQTITIMPSIKQGLILYNQIYLSKQVFVHITKIF